jgi:hypothetical protein
MAALPPFAWSTTLRKTEELLAFCQKSAEFLRAVSKLKILDGQFIEITFDAFDGATPRHSLGRPYNGMIVVNTSNAGVTPMISCLPARSAQRAGVDPTKYVAVGAETAWTGTVTAWVF